MTRRPWVAAILTFLVPGLGQIYAGASGRGGLVFVLWIIVNVVLFKITLALPGMWGPVVFLISALIALIAIMADAARTARQAPRPFVLAPYHRWYMYLILFIVWAIVTAPFRAAVRRQYEAFKVPTESMAPTIVPGDWIFTTASPGLVARGAIVVFRHDGRSFIKRVVGISGDTIAMRQDSLRVDGHYFAEPYATPGGSTWGPLVVPPDSCFVLGDNRPNSLDSRHYGFVPLDSIVRWPMSVYFSMDPATHAVRWNRIGRDVSR